MSDRVVMTVGSRIPILSGTITRPGNLEFGLVTADIDEIQLFMRAEGAAVGVYKINAPVTSFEVSADGKAINWTYEWADGDTDTLGKYSAQFRVRLTDGRDAYAPTGEPWLPVVIKAAL